MKDALAVARAGMAERSTQGEQGICLDHKEKTGLSNPPQSNRMGFKRSTLGWLIGLAAPLVAASPALAQPLCEDAAGAEQAFAQCREALRAKNACKALDACDRAERLCPSAADTFASARKQALASCPQPCEEGTRCLGAGFVCVSGSCVAPSDASERVLEVMLEASSAADPCRRFEVLSRAARMARDASLAGRARMLHGRLSSAKTACERVSGLGDVALVGRDGAPMVLVPGGPFQRGSDDEGVAAGLAVCRESYASPEDCTEAWFSREQPRRKVELSPFYVDVYEVTNGRYLQCVESGACEPIAWERCRIFDVESGEWRKGQSAAGLAASAPEHPVVCATWREAQSYCAWAGKRLPTEAEWEKAARGAEGRAFPWGDAWEPSWLNWGEDQGYGGVDGFVTSAPVGSFPRNKSPYGAMDMAGNVWEWTHDWHGETFYARASVRDPYNTKVTGFKVLRGGSWHFAGNGARAAFRYLHSPSVREDTIGFRCALGRALSNEAERGRDE